MSIEQFCTKDVITIEATASLKEASKKMKDHHIGCLVVTEDQSGKSVPTGVVTDRDIALALSTNGNTQVQQIMMSHPVTMEISTGVYEVIQCMKENGIRRIPLIGKEGSLCGIVTSDKLIQLLGEELSELSKIGENQKEKEEGRFPPEKKTV